MMRLPAFLRSSAPAIVLACLTAMPVTRAFAEDAAKPADAPAPAATPDAPAPAAPADATKPPAPAVEPTTAPATQPTTQPVTAKPIDPDLLKNVTDFWNNARLGRNDEAATAGNAILAAKAAPEDVLAAFNAATENQGADITGSLRQWQDVKALKDISSQLLTTVVAGRDDLNKSVDDFWHYARIGRYQTAAEAGRKVLASSATPVQLLAAFNDVSKDRGDDVNGMLLRWQESADLRDVSSQLLSRITEGRNKHRMDVGFIQQQIDRLAVNERGYVNGLEALRQSGEIAVPFLVATLHDRAKPPAQHEAARRALIDLGRAALNPLLACTEMKNDPDTLIELVSVLGQIGYNDTVPYLARLATDKNVAPAVQASATRALERMGNGDPKSLNTAALFLDLGEKFYYGTSAVAYDLKNPTAYVWFYDDKKGLYKEDVTPSIWNDLMAMRAAEYSLKADATKPDAVNLWLSADYRRESDLGADGVDPINKGKPAASFYGTQAGVTYLNAVLTRAMRDHASAVALKSIESLEGVAGASSLYSGDVKPLTDSMGYPDRLVRFEAALVAANALPQKTFNGQEQVVPILAEAIAQTGKTNALLLTGSQDAYNKMSEQLKAAGYGTAGGTTPEQAAANSAQLPSIDVIVIDTTSGIDQTIAERMLGIAGTNPRLAQLARVFVGASEKANAFSALSIGNPLVTVTTATQGAQLAPVLQKARERSGSLPLDEKTAATYSLRAADALGKLAVSRAQVLNLADAQPTLLGALDDARADVAKASANVLGMLDSKEPQPALLTKAADDKTADDLKVPLLKAGAANARFYGNRLSADQVATLRKLADAAKSVEVKGAAAEFLGALNLTSDEAKTLIVKQARNN